MSKKNTEQLISSAKSDIGNDPVIAFVGKTRYGKTVVSTLLYDALFQYFIPHNNGKFTAAVVRGFDTIYQTHKLMTEGKFPPGTFGQRPEVLIEISNTDLAGGKVELLLRDLSGEDNHELLSTERNPASEQANAVLSYRSGSSSYGPFAYLLFAKLYVIMVDCSKYNEWRSEGTKFGQIVKTIFDMKTVLNEIYNKKMVAPIAILLTKSDKLPENIRNLPADEIVKHHTPILYSALENYHAGERDYFKVSVDTEQANDIEFAQMKNNLKQDLERTLLIERTELERQINEEVAKAIASTKTQAIQNGVSPEVAEQQAQNAGEEKRKSLTAIPSDTLPTKIPTDEELKEKLQKIKIPLVYTHTEYIRFISWILRVMPKK